MVEPDIGKVGKQMSGNSRLISERNSDRALRKHRLRVAVKALALFAIAALLISSIATMQPARSGATAGHRRRMNAIVDAVPSVTPPQLVTDVNATYSLSINTNGPFNNATVYFGDGTSTFVQPGGTSTVISVSHVFKSPGYYMIWYTINYPSGPYAGTNDMIPVQVLDTHMSQNASLGMLMDTMGGFIKTPGSNASFCIYYNSAPVSSIGISGQDVYQVYNQYLVVDRAGINGNYALYASKEFGYSFNSSAGAYGFPAAASYYNMTSLKAGFYQLKLYTATALVNQSTGALGGIRQNATAVWDFVVNASSALFENYAGQFFNRIEPTNGNYTLDPQIAYNTVPNEILMNTMQELVGEEGSSTSAYFPELASALPTPGNGINNVSVTRTISEYVNGAWTSSSVTYAPLQVYTFTIRSNATWQDGTQVNSWDAAFSIIRDLLFVGGSPGTPGWILAQALLPGNYYQSNSFQNITNNVTWSNASDTLTLYLQHPTPPTLLFQYMSSPGVFVSDANWTYAHGEGLNFSPAGFTDYMKYGNSGQTNPYLYTHVMSDGPYVLEYNMPGNIMYLEANANYHPPAAANGTEWAPAASIGNIMILYTTSPYGSFLKFKLGYVGSISSGILSPADWQQTQSIMNGSRAVVDSFPTLSLFWFNFNALVNLTLLQGYYSAANLPPVFFDSLTVRRTFAYAFQYDQYLNQQIGRPLRNISFATKYAGMLPAGMLYNQSISDLNSTTVGVPYFNLTVAQTLWAGFVNSSMGSAMGISYSSTGGVDLYNGKPLNVPIFTFIGDQATLEGAISWGSYMQQVIPGFQYAVIPASFYALISSMSQGLDPFPIYELGWAPDYPYPTDYLGPMALPVNSSAYPGPNAMTPYWFNGNPSNQLMGQPQMVKQADNMTSMINDYQNATVNDMPQAQRWFQAMNEMLINMTFYVYLYQQPTVLILSSKLNFSRIVQYEENGVYGSGGDVLFNVLAYNEYTVEFNQTGLPSGSPWFVNFTGHFSSGPVYGSTYSVPMTNGTYAYTVSTSNLSFNIPPSGSFNVSGGRVSIDVSFTGKPTYTVVFSETGLGSNSQWYVNITGIHSSGPLSSSTVTYTASLFNGTFSFSVASSNKTFKPVYTGDFTVNGGSLTVSITFVKVTYPVVFSETGLPSGTEWNVTVLGVTQSSTTGSITFSEENGSYAYQVQGLRGYSVALSGGLTVAGSSLNIPVVYSKNATVYLDVHTPSATLTVDGVATAYGSVPLVLSLQQGYHFINVSRSGYQTFTDLFYFGPSTYYVNITLIPLTTFGYLAGTVYPANAYISASGISVSVTNGQFDQSLPTGSYYVSVEAQGYASENYLVNISNGQVTYLNVTLQRVNQSYTISGTVDPSNSSVMFGSYTAYVNSTGFYVISLPAGNYNYSVADSGYFPSTGSIDVTSDLTLNFNLAKEPPAQSVVVTSNITASGYNLTVSNLTDGNGNISVDFNASVSGTLVVQIPYSQIKNATVSDIMSSKVYVNGTMYPNFSIALSTINGTFSVILTVYGLQGDPVMEWAYLPSVAAPAPPLPAPSPAPAPPQPFTVPWYVYVIIGDAAVVMAAVLLRWDRDRRK